MGLVLDKLKTNRVAHFCLSWIREMYKNLVKHYMYDEGARVYMLRLIGFTILTDKSHVYIDTRYISLFV